MSHHKMDQDAGLIGQPIRFVSGQFAGQTVRAQLDEIQKADLGRKYVCCGLTCEHVEFKAPE